MTQQMDQQNDEIDGLLLNLVKKGISWIEDYLHAQQHVCINLNTIPKNKNMGFLNNNANPIEILNDGPYLTNKHLNIEYETIKKDLSQFAAIEPDVKKLTDYLQKETSYDYTFYGNDVFGLFPFGGDNFVLYLILTHYELDKEANWTSDGFKDALFDLTRYFELLVYYDYYYAFTCMDVSKYDYDEKKVQTDKIFNKDNDPKNKIFNKPLTQQVNDEIYHYLLQVAFRQHYLIFKLFYEKCQFVNVGYQTILPIENYRLNIPAMSLKVGTEQEIIKLTYTDSRYRSHNQIYNIYQLLTTFNQQAQEKAVLKMKDTYLDEMSIYFLKLSPEQQQLLYYNIIDVKPELTTMHEIFTKKFDVKENCKAAMNTLVRYVYPNSTTAKEQTPGIKYIVSRLLNIQFIYHLDVILEQICKYVDKSSLAVYYHLTLLERENDKITNDGKNSKTPKKNESKHIEIPYGEIFDKVLNSKPIPQQVVTLRTQIRSQIQLINNVYDQLFSMYYKPKLVKGRIPIISDLEIVQYVNKAIDGLTFEDVKVCAERTYELFKFFNTKSSLEKKVMEILNITTPQFFVKDGRNKEQIEIIIQSDDYYYKKELSEYIMQRILFCQNTIAEQKLNFKNELYSNKEELFAIVFEIYIGLLPSYINHANRRTIKSNLSDEILNQTLIQVMLDNLEKPNPNTSDVDKLLYEVKTYAEIYPQRCQQFYTLMLNKLKYCFEKINNINDIQLPVGYDLLNQFYLKKDSGILQTYKDIYNNKKVNKFVEYCEQTTKIQESAIKAEESEFKAEESEFKIEQCEYLHWYTILDKFRFRQQPNGSINPNITGIKNIFIKKQELIEPDANIKNLFQGECGITVDGVKQMQRVIFEVEKELEIDQNLIAGQFGISVSLLDKAQSWISAHDKNQSRNNTK